MYKKILVALENSSTDAALLPHITELAAVLHSKLLLVHVADGWVARHYDEWQLIESDEMIADKKYLAETAALLRQKGLDVETHLALGDPPEEILKMSELKECDLIAMSSHGHRFYENLFLGSTISEVRCKADVPVLIVKAVKS